MNEILRESLPTLTPPLGRRKEETVKLYFYFVDNLCFDVSLFSNV